jgi:hypothetical protein
MVALAILVVSVAILVETQGSAAKITRDAEQVITATDLANAKMNETLLFVEEEGFTNNDISESGDFDDFGDEAFDLAFGKELSEYHWEFWVSEIDLALAGDIAGMASELESSGVIGGGGGGGDGGPASLLGGSDGGGSPLANLGISSEMITEMLTPYIREVRVRVWWGEDSDEAEERGDEIVVVTHLVNPTGTVFAGSEDPAAAAQ